MPDGRLRHALVLVAWICAAAASGAERPLLVFHGNVVLVDGVYRSYLDLPPDARATPELARQVRTQLRKFLRDAGYELASVRATVEGDHIEVDIDEGRLDKVIILGSGVIETLRLKLDVDVPFKVFNRPALDQKLRDTSRRLGLSKVSYELVPVPVRRESGLQLDELPSFHDFPLFEPGRPYELQISLASAGWRAGIAPDVEIDSLEGGGLGVEYRNRGLLLADDRWSVQGKAAAAVRDRLDRSGSSIAFTHGTLGGRWQSPPILDAVRPSLSLRADAIDRQRSDLRLERFEYATLEGSLGAEVTVKRIWSAALGLGLQRRWLFGLEPIGGAVPLVGTAPIAQTRPYLDAAFGVTFDPLEVRRDRRHELHLDARWYAGAVGNEVSMTQLRARYQKIFALGWNELWIDGQTTYLAGDVLFPEEASIGDVLHGPFSSIYARRLAAAGAEFRLSLLRDVVKVGLFDNLALFGAIDRASDTESLRAADSFGLGFHALLFDALQLDIYMGLALSRKGELGNGATLSLRQAY